MMKTNDIRPSIGTAVSFTWDGVKLNGIVTSHSQCPAGHVEVTVTKCRRKAYCGVYVLRTADLTIKS